MQKQCVILQEFKSEAEKRNIHFRSDFYYPTGTDINAFDVSVILNNALQNAMENVGKSELQHGTICQGRLTNPLYGNLGCYYGKENGKMI